jgi:single-strand DNA-binding protein
MPNLNSCHLIGRLTRDPDVRFTSTGVAIADISLAVSRFYKTDQGDRKEETDFIDVTAFGKTGELMRDYLHKGDPCFIDGRLKLDQWDDRETGKKRTKLRVIAERLEFLSSKPQSESRAPSPPVRTKPAPDFSKPPRDPDLDPNQEPDDINF